MTDEELVAEYLKDDSKYLIEDAEGNLINIAKKVREAFLAGRPRWHKVADGNLPKVNSAVLDENGDKVVYIGGGEWEAYSEYYEKYVGVSQPFAWCEVPRYTEEINK